MPSEVVFNVRALFSLSADRLYRVYLLPNEIAFIRVGGQGFSSAAFQRQGLIAHWIGYWLMKRAKERQQENIAKADSQNPLSMIRDHKHNFLVKRGDFASSAIEPAGFSGHGEQQGMWRGKFKNNRKFRYQFETLADMHTAYEHLPKFLYPRVQVNTTWNEEKQLYVKRKK